MLTNLYRVRYRAADRTHHECNVLAADVVEAIGEVLAAAAHSVTDIPEITLTAAAVIVANHPRQNTYITAQGGKQ